VKKNLKKMQNKNFNLETRFINIKTTFGEILVELYPKEAPKTCYNFLELCKQGYYNNIIFHRVIKNFIIQTGDPTGTGKGGESIYGKTFEDEITQDLKHTGAGILSMANAGPNTNSSQFFITLAPTPWLDNKHTIFGRVFSGLKIVQRLGSVKTDKNDKPIEEIKIISTKLESKKEE
jgi:peptidyl-prolyl cis-trans isomerase-like 1